MNYIEIKAPAKINIGLDILSKRADGYHNLSTLFYPIVDLYDILTFTPSQSFIFHCSSDIVPKNGSNLVVKAKNLLEHYSKKKLNVTISLEKKIPSQAGLGGGSSDAAATLISINEMFGLGIKHAQMIDLALQLGSDVPFFIKSKPAIGTLRGEKLDYINFIIDEPILVINPKINISTKEAFNMISPTQINSDYHSLIKNEKLDYRFMRTTVKNDFERFTFDKYPEIGKIKSFLYDEGALFALMSGSGSTLYGIYQDYETAENVINKLPRNYFCFLSNPHH
jgi:4-diphosphocytidyl-2-C-methyl-D-erythritol kinase